MVSSPLQFNDIEEYQFVPFTTEEYRVVHEKYVETLTQFAKEKHLDYDYSKFSVSFPKKQALLLSKLYR